MANKRMTLDDYWNDYETAEEWPLKYALYDWSHAEYRLNKEWLAKVREEQQKILLWKALVKRLINNPDKATTPIAVLYFWELYEAASGLSKEGN